MVFDDRRPIFTAHNTLRYLCGLHVETRTCLRRVADPPDPRENRKCVRGVTGLISLFTDTNLYDRASSDSRASWYRRVKPRGRCLTRGRRYLSHTRHRVPRGIDLISIEPSSAFYVFAGRRRLSLKTGNIGSTESRGGFVVLSNCTITKL